MKIRVSGLSSPYPQITGKKFELEPDVYVLPGQNWEMLFSFRSLKFSKKNKTKTLRAFVRYQLYDGDDGLGAMELLRRGISVSPKNLDWLKRIQIEEKNMRENDPVRYSAPAKKTESKSKPKKKS